MYDESILVEFEIYLPYLIRRRRVGKERNPTQFLLLFDA